MKPHAVVHLLRVTSLLLGIGLGAPCMTISPRFGEFSGVVAMLKPSMLRSTSFSVLDGIAELGSSGEPSHVIIGVVVALFSVVLPIWKLWVLHSAVLALEDDRPVGRSFRIVERLGKFSMIDVFVMALAVLTVKGLPGGSEVKLEWGLLAFTAAAIGSTLLSSVVDRAVRGAGIGRGTSRGGTTAGEHG